MSNREKNGRWKSGGPSPNPAGKPRGALSSAGKIRELIGSYLEPVVASLIRAAARGDVQAAGLLLARALPPARPERPMITVDLTGATTPAQIAQRVVDAAARGEVSVDTAHDFVAAVTNVAKLVESAELVERIAKLEAANEGSRSAR
jgi:hypothetical protein